MFECLKAAVEQFLEKNLFYSHPQNAYSILLIAGSA
jgi:hypothetical protein